jgi:hypothetical protein
MAENGNRFTIYDVMSQRGDFRQNPANRGAKDHRGLSIFKKADFPQILYHPSGEEVIAVPAEAVATPFGPKMVGEQRRLKTKTVHSEEELAEALASGWHKHPAKAHKAAGRAVEVPKVNRQAVQDQIAALQATLAAQDEEEKASVEPIKNSPDAPATGAAVIAKLKAAAPAKAEEE